NSGGRDASRHTREGMAMTLHPAYEVLRQHGIRFVANSPDGTFKSNCPNPKCGKQNNFVHYDDECVGWHCHDCGDSKIVPLRPARTQTGGSVASVPFMLTTPQKEALHALGYSNEQILHLKPQEGQDIIAQKRKAPAIEYAPPSGNGSASRDDA